MNKSIAYTGGIILILIIGFIIGFLVNGMVTRQKIRKMRTEFTERGFNRQFIRALDPTAEQMEQLRPVLRKYGQKHREMMISMQSDQTKLFDDFRDEIIPYLSDDQIRRLDRIHRKRMEREGPHHRLHHRRPGPER